MVKDLVQAIKWKRATQIFGNSHASLIGLVSEAWVRRGRPGEERFVLDAPPAVNGLRGKRPDVLFGERKNCVGIAEVEGQHPVDAINKFRTYFRSYGQNIFGLCVIYPYFLRGCTGEKEWRFAKGAGRNEGIDDIHHQAESLSRHHPKNPFMLVLVEKKYHPDYWLTTEQDKSEWYRGRVSGVTGYSYLAGQRTECLTLLE